VTAPRRVIVRRPGGYERLAIEPFEPGPRPPGHVRIAVDAIGVNYADCVARMGLYASAAKYVGWPLVPGFEVAGRVEALDAPTDALAVGDAVVAVTRFGGYATVIDVPAHQVRRVPIVPTPHGPRPLGIVEAAGVPTVYATAWYALFPLAAVRKGQRLLVHSAAGGVGGAILQLARLAGCETVGVVGRSEKVEVARTLGATHVIDKRREDLFARARALSPRGYDVVLDANGAETLARSYEALASPGRLVVYGFHSMLPRRGGRPSWPRLALSWLRTPRFDPLRMTGENRSVMAFNLSYLFEERALLEEALRVLWDGLASGALAPLPTRAYPLEDVAAAHAALESGTTTGKLVLTA
jgi:NADPH:quinone reductase-like Zn-dependent oxidoreductase